MTRYRHALFSVSLLIAALVGLVGGSIARQSRAEAWTASSLYWLTMNEDAFGNYDFTSQNYSSTGVDWPVDILFHNNASTSKVKIMIDGYMDWPGGYMYQAVDDGPGWGWTQDDGRKNVYCPVTGQTNHLRYYADGWPGDRSMYNVSWGYYVIATAHRDIRECGSDPIFGYSEDAEGDIVNLYGSLGTNAVHDWASFSNYQYGWEGNHYWQNDGNASYINVP